MQSQGRLAAEPGMDVHLVTTAHLPRDRYSPQVHIHTSVATRTNGFAPEGLNLKDLRCVLHTVDHPTTPPDSRPPIPDTRHLTPGTCLPLPAVHLWKLALVPALRRRGLPVVRTLHDWTPTSGYASAG